MTCPTCRRPLDTAAQMVRDTTCTSCRILALQRPDDEWSFFLRTIRALVRDDGTLHVNDARPLLRGKVEPKHIGQFWKRAAALGLIRFKEWEQSTDEAGGNSDKLARVHVWTAKSRAAAPPVDRRVLATTAPRRSAWDEREESTWLDRM